jgi:hypothetical protein
MKSAIPISMTVCLALMWICVIVQGLFMLFSLLGPFFPHPHLYAASFGCYVLLAISLLFIRSRGWSVLRAGWLLAAVCAALWWYTTDEEFIPWFLYQNCLPICFVLISHIRWLLIWHSNRERGDAALNNA